MAGPAGHHPDDGSLTCAAATTATQAAAGDITSSRALPGCSSRVGPVAGARARVPGSVSSGQRFRANWPARVARGALSPRSGRSSRPAGGARAASHRSLHQASLCLSRSAARTGPASRPDRVPWCAPVFTRGECVGARESVSASRGTRARRGGQGDGWTGLRGEERGGGRPIHARARVLHTERDAAPRGRERLVQVYII